MPPVFLKNRSASHHRRILPTPPAVRNRRLRLTPLRGRLCFASLPRSSDLWHEVQEVTIK